MSEQQSPYGPEAQVQAVLDVQDYLASQPTSTICIAPSLLGAAESLAFANLAVQRYQPSVIAKLGTTASGEILDLQGRIPPKERILHTQLFALGRFGTWNSHRHFVLSHRHVAAPEHPYGAPTIRQTTIKGSLGGPQNLTARLCATHATREVAPLSEIDYEDLFMALLCSGTARDVREHVLASRQKTLELLEQVNPRDKKATKELRQRLDSAGLPEAPWALA